MDSSENVISWNFPNVVTIWLMVALLWVVMGMGSHLLRRKMGGTSLGVKTNGQGGIVS